MNRYYVYLHVKSTNGEPFYVGKGINDRIFSKNGRNTVWNRIVNKYGYDQLYLEQNLTETEAFKIEIYWINRIGTLNTKTGTLCNIAEGGNGGNTIKFMSDLDKTNMAIKKSNSMKGKNKGKKFGPQSEEHKIKVQESCWYSKTTEQKEEILKKRSDSMKGKNKGKIMSQEQKELIRSTVTGKKWYTDGVNNFQRLPNTEPIGTWLGRTLKIKNK